MVTVNSVSDSSGDGVVVDIQSHFANGLPTLTLIGVVGKSLDESRERVRSAFASSGLTFPKKKITCNIAPSDMPKNGSHFDLGIALSILIAAKLVRWTDERIIVIGELSLDGSVTTARGIIGKILIAKQAGFKKFIIPLSNFDQARLIPDIEIATVKSLKELCSHLLNSSLEYLPTNGGFSPNEQNSSVLTITNDMQDIIGQVAAKRALEIAAAGRHNVLLSGPPGVGKSMLAKALIGILPPLNREEIIAVTHLHSLVGSSSGLLINQRPIRAPHHSISDTALIGGGQHPRPGEISLSHAGVLFLDELPEFKRATLESLRQPLEDGTVSIARAQQRITYPADFLLIATKNPCPCGYYGSNKPCVCSPLEIDRYQKKLSGPILDRIDLHVTVDSIDHRKLLETSKNTGQENSATIKKRVLRALELQKNRFDHDANLVNGKLQNRDIKRYAKLSSDAKDLLDTAAARLDLSARVYMKIVKIARTIADLDDSPTIEIRHVSEAIQYRPLPIS